ncbi:MAG: hypothetical protein K8W52_17560 [Deltaproteobacteria bacterium]|nr:hypothetical protein [Deltaproteobacteria bacterium]
MRKREIWLVALCAAGAVAACVDVQGGEVGTYGSPCGSGFQALLLCGREAGGADPQGSTSPDNDRPATCADACAVLVSCNSSGGSVSDCTGECIAEAPLQSLLDCIVAAGCEYQTCVP